MIATLLFLTATSAHALAFTIASVCNEAEYTAGKSLSWCIEGHFAVNEKVSFLKRRDCHAKTGELLTIESATEELPGTTLVDFHCPDAEYGDVVVLGVDVKKYRDLTVKEISEKKIPKGLDARIRKSADFRRLITEHDPAYDYSERLKMHLFTVIQSTARPKIYIAKYQSDDIPDHFLFLVSKNRVETISGDEPGCYGNPEAFRLNEVDVLRIDGCVCGTDACGRQFLNLSDR